MYKPLSLLTSMFALLLLAAGCGSDSTGPDQQATTGTLEVTTATSGPDQDADGYLITVDGDIEQPADTTDNITFEKLTEGSHTIELSGTSPSCEVEGEATQTLKVSAGKTATASFSIRCKAALINKIVFVGYKNKQPNLYVAKQGTIPPIPLTADDLRQAHPDVFPDGTKVAYEAGGNIWTVGADEKGAKQLTDSGEDHAPSACPDGSLLFTSLRDGRSQLYWQSDGGKPVRIETENPLYEPSCNPAGNPTYEAAVQVGSGARSSIGLVDVDAPKGKRLKILTENDYLEADPVWTPDGKSLVCVIASDKSALNLATISAETGKIQEQSSFEPGFIDMNADPSVSPDGKWILFTSIKKAKRKLSPDQLQASDYNATRSNRTHNGIVDISFGDGFRSVMHAAYSPRLK